MIKEMLKIKDGTSETLKEKKREEEKEEIKV